MESEGGARSLVRFELVFDDKSLRALDHVDFIGLLFTIKPDLGRLASFLALVEKDLPV